jgi:hypothetical protein
MDLRAYYEKIRETEKELTSDFVIVVSKETAEGGKAGVTTEVTRNVAARMIVEGTARAASSEESEEHRLAARCEAQEAEARAQAGRLQIAIVPAAEARSVKAGPKPVKA